MTLTAQNLYRDSASFFRHQFKPLLLISLVCAFVTVLLDKLFASPSSEIINLLQGASSTGSLFERVKSISPQQQEMLLHTSAVMTFTTLIGDTLLLGGVLRLVQAVSGGKTISALNAIGASATVWPRLLIQTFLITLIVQLGFLVLIVPGIILLVLLSLSPVLLLQENRGLFRTMKQSIRLSWNNFRLIVPAVAGWLLVKMVLNMLGGALSSMPLTLAPLALDTLSNLASALLLVYLYRLLTQLR